MFFWILWQRYRQLSDKQERSDFCRTLVKFVRTYSFLIHIIRFGDVKLHKVYAFAKALV